MINILKQSGTTAYNNVELLIDTEAEIADLSTAYALGSAALILETGNLYFLREKGWVKM